MPIDQVTEDIWIADIQSVREENTNQFDTIISVCQDSVESNVSTENYYHFSLSDGPPELNSHNPGEFSYTLFAQAVKTTINNVEDNNTTLVHCHMGQSRSVMVIAAALGELYRWNLPESVNIVADSRSIEIDPSDPMWDYAERYNKQSTGVN